MNELSTPKLAYYQAQAEVLYSLGFSDEQVKLAMAEQGIYKDASFWGAIGKGLSWVGKGIGKALGSVGKGTATAGKAVAHGPVAPGSAMGMGQRAAGAFTAAGEGMANAPWQTMWQGAKNFGRGLTFSSKAKGIGGALGKGTTGYAIGSSVLGGR